MDHLKTYLKELGSEDQREAFARRCGTSLGHLRNCIYDPKKTVSAELCVALERESGRAVRRWHIRADWPSVWPELVKADGAPAAPDDGRSDEDAAANAEG